jgi:hypothetical protein
LVSSKICCIFAFHFKTNGNMKALLIDPATRTVTPIEIEKGLAAIYAAMDCTMIEAPIEFDNGDTLYVDEEGKLKGEESITGGFTYPKTWNAANPCVNKCLVVGTNRKTGNDVSCKSTPDYILNNPEFGAIRWLGKEEAQSFAY